MDNHTSSRAGEAKRIRFNFWLDTIRDLDKRIIPLIKQLKAERLFTQTIRDGIRLICDLRDGKLDVLFELFPWVRAEFMEYVRDLQPVIEPEPTQHTESQSVIHTDQAWIDAEQERIEAERRWEQKRLEDAQKALDAERAKIETERRQSQNAIQQQLERLEQLLLQQGNQPISGIQPVASGGEGSPKPIGIAPKTLDVPKFASPVYDDDDDDFELDVTKDKTAGMKAINNFLTSIQRVQGANRQ